MTFRTPWVRRSLAVALITTAALTPLACGTARRGEPLRGPLALSDEREQHGEVVFMRNCQKCHPGGEAGLGPAINNKPLPSFLKRFQVRHGLGAMPSFSKDRLSDRDLGDLLEYLEALRAHKESRG